MEKISRELNILLVDVFNEINDIEERKLREIGGYKLSLSEFHTVACVGSAKGGTRTIGEIAEALGVTLPTVTVAVQRLEKKGFLRREKNENDGRSSLISLTEEGEKINRLHKKFHKKMIGAVEKELTEEEISVLYRAIKKLNEFFKENY